MHSEAITTRDELVIRRLILAPGDATPWHADRCHRFTVVVRGRRLTLEYRDGEKVDIDVRPGQSDWDEPNDRVHRAVNTGGTPYEEVVTFYRDDAGVEPQPLAPKAT